MKSRIKKFLSGTAAGGSPTHPFAVRNPLVIIFQSEGGVTFEGASDEWNEAWPEAKREGWKARKVGHDWVHGCPDCEV